MIEGPRTLVGIYSVASNVGHLSPTGEKVWQRVDHQRQLPCGRQVAGSPPVSTSPSLVSLSPALGLSPLIQATPSPSAFPVPLSRSLHLALGPAPSLSSLIPVLSFREGGRQAATAASAALSHETRSLRPAVAHLDRRREEGEAHRTPCRRARGLCLTEAAEDARFTPMGVAAASPVISLFSP